MRAWPSRCILEVVRAVLLIAAVCSTGCVESHLVAMQPPIDTFWLQQEIAAMHEPKPTPVRSISLGYIGDAPLTGGVMRDTPMPAP
jgi:hypothetical protein